VNPLAQFHFQKTAGQMILIYFHLNDKPEFSLSRGKSSSSCCHSNQNTHFSRPLNREEFTRRLAYNLDVYKKEIYRVKGILCFENEPFEFILQGVGGNFEIYRR
jgi:G3E family GTPase